MVFKELIQKHKDRVNIALEDLDSAIYRCSKETPRAVASALYELESAVDNNVLHKDEESAYKRLISDRITQFEKTCNCSK